jgi:O-acetyl-ADP-ribose deacetylase
MLGVVPIHSESIKKATAKLIVSSGSVVPFSGDAIVNAANEECLGGGGVDGAISNAGGDSLYEARLSLPIKPGTSTTRVDTGSAVITIGGQLNASWCIHAVGPNYWSCSNEGEGDKLLSSAYKASMELAKQQTDPPIKTIAFSLLSAGVFRGKRSLKEVLRIAVKAVKGSAYEGLEEVHLVAFKESEQKLLVKVCAEEKEEEEEEGEEEGEDEEEDEAIRKRKAEESDGNGGGDKKSKGNSGT